jgi:hypothetical protein
MDDANRFTREHARTVLYYSTAKSFGFVIGRGWDDPKNEQRFHEFWAKLANLDAGGSDQDRKKSIALWRQWIANSATMPN